MKTKDLSFIEFCIDFAKKYKDLPDGLYKSENEKYSIEKLSITGSYTSTRVNIKTNEVQINNNLNHFTVSGILYSLFWAFLRVDCKNDIDSDNKSKKLLSDQKDFSVKDALLDHLEIIKHTPVDNADRIKNLLSKT